MSAAPLLYLVTDRHASGGRPLVDVVAAALRGAGALAGRIAVQLREKDLSARALLELARPLRDVTAAAGAALFVNDRIDVAAAAGADGVHLARASLSIAEARAVAPGLRVAVSTHAPQEVAAAAAGGADFVVFGPIWDTPSKRGLIAPAGLDGLRRACAAAAVISDGDSRRVPISPRDGLRSAEPSSVHAIPVLALGGVDAGNARECLRAGAIGVACIRSVIGATDPARAVAAFLPCFDGLL